MTLQIYFGKVWLSLLLAATRGNGPFRSSTFPCVFGRKAPLLSLDSLDDEATAN